MVSRLGIEPTDQTLRCVTPTLITRHEATLLFCFRLLGFRSVPGCEECPEFPPTSQSMTSFCAVVTDGGSEHEMSS